MPRAPKLAYYAVRRGHRPGIYFSWNDCLSQIKGFPGPIFKKFPTEAEAEAFVTAETRGSHASAWNASSSPTNYQPVSSTSTAVARIAQPTDIPDQDEKEFDVVYCDGACKRNGGTGPAAGIGVWWGHNDPRNLSERCPGDQTNNRAELMAIVRVLETTPPLKRKLLIKTDSRYSIGCVTSWIFKWMTNGFRTADGQPVKNRALIKYLAALLHARRSTSQTIEFKHVQGHAGLEGNEAADRLANIGASQPPLPERDWEQLEQNLSKNMEREEKQLDVYDLQAYAEGLLDGGELFLSNTSIGSIEPRVVSTTSPTDVNRCTRPAKATNIPVITHPPPTATVRRNAELEDYASCLLNDSQLAEMAADGEFPSDY